MIEDKKEICMSSKEIIEKGFLNSDSGMTEKFRDLLAG